MTVNGAVKSFENLLMFLYPVLGVGNTNHKTRFL